MKKKQLSIVMPNCFFFSYGCSPRKPSPNRAKKSATIFFAPSQVCTGKLKNIALIVKSLTFLAQVEAPGVTCGISLETLFKMAKVLGIQRSKRLEDESA